MNIKEHIIDRIYWAVAESTGMPDRYAAEEIANDFWNDTQKNNIPLEKFDEHFTNFINDIYNSPSVDEEE